MNSTMDKSIENIVFMVFVLFVVVGGLAAFATYKHYEEKENKKMSADLSYGDFCKKKIKKINKDKICY